VWAADPVGTGVFISYRRVDTGWAAVAVADALRRRLGPSAEVFLDNRSIRLGQAFAGALENGVRSSAVFVALIGPRWDQPPLVDRLHDPQDWVRRELLFAAECHALIVPVLVDRDSVPAADPLPEELRFIRGMHVGRIRQHNGRDPDLLAEEIAKLLPRQVGGVRASVAEGVEPKRTALDAFLRRHLPPAQQWMGNRDRLVNLALAVLGPDDRLLFVAPGRINDGPRGSAAVFVTRRDVVVVEVDEGFVISGEIRFPRSLVGRVEVVPTLPLFADVLVHTTAGDAVRLQGLFRDQAGQFADQLRH
jgi:hypothetical protein